MLKKAGTGRIGCLLMTESVLYFNMENEISKATDRTCYLGDHLKRGFNPTALRKANIVYKFGLSECNKIKKTEEYQSGGN